MYTSFKDNAFKTKVGRRGSARLYSPTSRRLRQEDRPEFKASISYPARLYFKHTHTQKKKNKTKQFNLNKHHQVMLTD